MEFINKNPALLLVDIQKAFLDKDYPGKKEIIVMLNLSVVKF